MTPSFSQSYRVSSTRLYNTYVSPLLRLGFVAINAQAYLFRFIFSFANLLLHALINLFIVYTALKPTIFHTLGVSEALLGPSWSASKLALLCSPERMLTLMMLLQQAVQATIFCIAIFSGLVLLISLVQQLLSVMLYATGYLAKETLQNPWVGKLNILLFRIENFKSSLEKKLQQFVCLLVGYLWILGSAALVVQGDGVAAFSCYAVTIAMDCGMRVRFKSPYRYMLDQYTRVSTELKALILSLLYTPLRIGMYLVVGMWVPAIKFCIALEATVPILMFFSVKGLRTWNYFLCEAYQPPYQLNAYPIKTLGEAPLRFVRLYVSLGFIATVYPNPLSIGLGLMAFLLCIAYEVDTLVGVSARQLEDSALYQHGRLFFRVGERVLNLVYGFFVPTLDIHSVLESPKEEGASPMHAGTGSNGMSPPPKTPEIEHEPRGSADLESPGPAYVPFPG